MKHIKIIVLQTEWCKLLKIVEQTHVGDEFYPESKGVFKFGDFALCSCTHPDIAPIGEPDRLYVWGTRPATNNRILVVPSEEWLSWCRATVRVYNEIHKDQAESKIDDNIEIIE